MKTPILTLALILACAGSLLAATMKTETIKLPTLQCGMCKEKIEANLQDLKGLKSIEVEIDEYKATVVFDSEVTTLEKIEEAITKVGYDANEQKADRKAQKKLHKCCQPGAHQ